MLRPIYEENDVGDEDEIKDENEEKEKQTNLTIN